MDIHGRPFTLSFIKVAISHRKLFEIQKKGFKDKNTFNEVTHISYEGFVIVSFFSHNFTNYFACL